MYNEHAPNIILYIQKQKASEVSKRASKMWKEISAKERMYWDRMAEKEKERYVAEKEVYDGPVSFYRVCACAVYTMWKFQGCSLIYPISGKFRQREQRR